MVAHLRQERWRGGVRYRLRELHWCPRLIGERFAQLVELVAELIFELLAVPVVPTVGDPDSCPLSPGQFELPLRESCLGGCPGSRHLRTVSAPTCEGETMVDNTKPDSNSPAATARPRKSGAAGRRGGPRTPRPAARVMCRAGLRRGKSMRRPTSGSSCRCWVRCAFLSRSGSPITR